MQIKTNNYLIHFNDDEKLLQNPKSLELLESLMYKLDDSQHLLSDQTFDQLELEISLINSVDMQEINLQQRGKDKTTDVLSFPSQENIRNGEYEVVNKSLHLGDILICHEVCESQAQEHDINYEDEFIHLIVHGLLHLYGYDHEVNVDEDKLMRNLEEMLINLIKN